MSAATMDKLAAELARLYLPADGAGIDAAALARHLAGQDYLCVPLAGSDGQLRALALPFERVKGDGEDGHWQRLCTVANALQAELDWPAPAVSITGERGYLLWLSFAAPLPAQDARRLLEGLRRRWLPELDPERAKTAVALPPCLHPRTGKWAAFIHPGMGASFADDPGLELPPPLAGQVAFLEGLESIGPAQLAAGLAALEPAADAGTATQAAASQTVSPRAVPAAPSQDGLLLKNATLEDIVAYLHARNIEPSFRFLKPQ